MSQLEESLIHSTHVYGGPTLASPRPRLWEETQGPALLQGGKQQANYR